MLPISSQKKQRSGGANNCVSAMEAEEPTAP